MVSDQANTRNPIFLMTCVLIVLIVTISIVMLYLSARQNALAKIQPYVIELEVAPNSSDESDAIEQIFAQYDYGYGFNREHQQIFTLDRGAVTQLLSFTVSGWKSLHSLKLITNGAAPVDIRQITISKNSLEYETNISGSLSVNSALVVENVQVKLSEMMQ